MLNVSHCHFAHYVVLISHFCSFTLGLYINNVGPSSWTLVILCVLVRLHFYITVDAYLFGTPVSGGLTFLDVLSTVNILVYSADK